MSAWAKPGVKCVCVDDTDHPELEVGGVYTVIQIKSADESLYQTRGKFAASAVWVEVSEAKNHSIAPYFAVERFRPLITRTQEQDLAVFMPLLTSLPIGEDA